MKEKSIHHPTFCEKTAETVVLASGIAWLSRAYVNLQLALLFFFSVGVKSLRSMNFMRNIELSTYLYEYHNLGKQTYLMYVSTSPKLQYVMECISSVKKYHTTIVVGDCK